MIVFWLGRCRLVHKLDQLQFSANSKDRFRVPDLLVVFDFQGKDLPVLIEVKVKEETKLSWRPDFIEALQAYSSLLELPLLVVWKNKTFWSLFEVRDRSKNDCFLYRPAERLWELPPSNLGDFGPPLACRARSALQGI